MPITVTVKRTRELSGLGNTKIWQLISTGQLQTVRVGRRRLVLYSSLRKLLRPPAVPKSKNEDRRGRKTSTRRRGSPSKKSRKLDSSAKADMHDADAVSDSVA
jgi:hypothetical protein